MLWQMIIALALVMVTVLVHTLGTVYLVVPLAGAWRKIAAKPVIVLTRLVSALLVLHLVEVMIWAGVFRLLGVFPDLETSVYFSLKSYTTVGYGDVLPPTQFRLLGPIEAAVGILMLGISTGVSMAVVQRLYSTREPDA